MRHPKQTTRSHRPASAQTGATTANPPQSSRLLAETVAFHIERGGQRIDATYSTRNGMVTAKYRDKTLSTYSPQADCKAVAHQLLRVMLTI